MKNIVVIGCSRSTGEEVRDWELDPHYYDAINEPQADWYVRRRDILIPKFMKENPELVIEGVDLAECWDMYNDRFAWPNLLDKEYNVINYAQRGAGIAFFELLYNLPNIVHTVWKGKHITSADYEPKLKYENGSLWNKYYTDDSRFDTNLEEADLLIWQLTNEPRYSLTFNEDLSVCNSAEFQSLEVWLENHMSGKKKHLFLEWYKYYYDVTRVHASNITWIKQLIKIRELKGLKTLIFPIYPTYNSRMGIKEINNEHTKSLGMDQDGSLSMYADQGLLSEELNLSTYDLEFRKDSYNCKYKHASEKGHVAIADYVNKTLKEWL